MKSLMTTSRYVERNRANAQKGTGPKTERGKAIIAGNAKRHGVMSRPEPKRVAIWLAIILDQPNMTLEDLLPDDEYGYRALALAEAEVRLATAEGALAALFHEEPKTHTTWRELVQEGIGVMALMDEVDAFAPLFERALWPSPQMSNGKDGPYTGKVTLFENRRRLLTRYAMEARSRRRRAFDNWIFISETRVAR